MESKRSGVSLVEILMVLMLGTMLLMAVVDLITITRKSAYKGFDKLENLTAARIILEKVQRDVKRLCYSGLIRKTPQGDVLEEQGLQMTETPETVKYRFPVFPLANPVDRKNPVNMVTYTFHRQQKTLIRQEIVNSLIKPVQADTRETLGEGLVLDFRLTRREIFRPGDFCYEIEVKCQGKIPGLKNRPVHLKTSMNSEFECRRRRNPQQIINQASITEFSR
jgi:competence protein ComGC